MNRPCVLITGILGQDGAYLAQRALAAGARVVGTSRSLERPAGRWRLERLGITAQVELLELDLDDGPRIATVLGTIRPDLVFNMAAQSSVARSFDDPVGTGLVTGMGAVRLFDAAARAARPVRILQPSSAEILGLPAPGTAGTAAIDPRTPYGAAKAYAHFMARVLRDSRAMHIATAILYNHESPLRDAAFVTRKITRGLARIHAGERAALRLGNLDARRDWTHARDIVEAMWRILAQDRADDYVLASGTSRSIRDFVGAAAVQLGMHLDWSGEGADTKAVDRRNGRVIVEVDPALFRPVDPPQAPPDLTKARQVLGWSATTPFETLVAEMVEAESRFPDNQEDS